MTATEGPHRCERLWPAGHPAADESGIDVYLASKQDARAAFLVFPGGGYISHSPSEGAAYAEWLNEQGYHAFVVRYRLGSAGYRHPAMLEDAARAVRWVRAHARELGVRTDRIGLVGSSAGGHLAALLLVHASRCEPLGGDEVARQDCRVDAGVLCYPVITLGQWGHAGSRAALLGDAPEPGMIELLSADLHVTSALPPCFLWHTVADQAVSVENSLLFATALRRAGVPFELHLYEQGGHGLGLGTRGYGEGPRHSWTHAFSRWISARWPAENLANNNL